MRGETLITASRKHIAELTLDPVDAAPLPEALEAIERADLITVGPGSLYTSLICNLLVQGIPAALASAHGVRVYICNLMTQANESLGLTASEHIERIYEHTRAPIFDCALVNTAPFSAETLARYAAQGAAPIVPDIKRIEALGVRCIAGDFASEESVVRHAAGRVTGALLALGRTGQACLLYTSWCERRIHLGELMPVVAGAVDGAGGEDAAFVHDLHGRTACLLYTSRCV